MDKYEYNLKLDQMKSLVAEKNYQAAAEIADTINWRKIKNVTALVRAGEIYENVGRYDTSKDILLMAYDRSPIGRTIIYRLARLAIKTANFDEAKEYYNEFVEIAPYDNLKYILKYEINKAQGADYRTLIDNLEAIKEQEFSEEWGYELAYTYHQAGMVDKCIETCDEIVLYFGDGVYVERALELKMLYQPLTRQQEAIYRQIRQQEENVVEVSPDDELESGEIVNEKVQIPPVKVSAERFNTQNLQKALQKSMEQIINATEKETVDNGMDAIKKLVEEIPYLQIPVEKETEADEEEAAHIATDQEIDDSLKLNFQEFLNEEYDGQMSLLVPEQGETEPQITGQMTIEDVLAEWERTRRAAAAALQEAEQKKFESAKARALQEAGDIMERLADVIPKLDSGLTPQDLLKEQYLSGSDIPEERAAQMVANMNQFLQKEIDRLSTENAQIDEQLAVAKETPAEEITEENIEEKIPSEEMQPEETPDMTELLADEELVDFLKSEGVFDALTEIEKPTETIEPTEETIAEEMEEAGDTSVEEAEILPEIELPQDLNLPIAEEEVKEPVKRIKTTEYFSDLNKEQKELFSYFIPIRGMEKQICSALNGMATRLALGQTAQTGNLIITGGSGSGKTVLATNFIKVLQKEIGMPEGKVGKIDAEVLNQKDVNALYNKITGGCLIIEGAGKLTKEAAVKLAFFLEHDTKGTLLILEDTKHGIDSMLAHDRNFASRFTERIDIPIFTSDELVIFAKAYAGEQGYVIDEMGVLALYNCISNIQKLDRATSIAEVKEIVDDAVAHAERGSIRKAFAVLTSSRYDENDYIILHERDFNN